jgi:hypothetical protein
MFAVHNEDCMEHVLSDHYVRIFRPAYHEYMSRNINFEDNCYSICLEILLRKFKDQIYGEFNFGKKRNSSLKQLKTDLKRVSYQ